MITPRFPDYAQQVVNMNADKVQRQFRYDNPVVPIQESLELQIKQFESELEKDQEIMIMAASFGSSVIFAVDLIEFNKPNIIIFHGRMDDGQKIRLIQHAHQLNFLLQAAKLGSNEERKPIGFIHN